MPTLYTFQAKSIQNYILDSNKLKDIVGASEQIESLCTEGGLLDNVLKVLNLENVKENFFRRAGGEFTVKFETEGEAKRFQSLWSYCVRQQVPGLSFIQNTHHYSESDDDKTAHKALKKENELVSNRLLVDFPIAGPLVARSRRTGGPAVKRADEETLDVVTQRKREFYKRKLLLKKVDPKEQFEWPTYFSGEEANSSEDKEFPLLTDNNYIGIVHADGNGLGSVLKNAMEKVSAERYQTALYVFSKGLEKATLKAIYSAIIERLPKYASGGMVMPARPLVVGGDDLTFIVRGDLALPFTEIFLEKFEQETEQVFGKLKEKYPEINLPPHLTACAGIAFVKAKQPFYQAYNLAESLCKYAKKIARKHQNGDGLMPSAFAFHRITTSLIDEYEDILKRELTIESDSNNEKIVLSMQPYFLGEVRTELTPRFSQLNDLAKSLRNSNVGRGAVRELLDLLYLDRELAKQRFERWQENLQKRDPKLKEDILGTLGAIVGKDHPNLPRLLKAEFDKQEKTTAHYSPLGDALALNNIDRGSDDE